MMREIHVGKRLKQFLGCVEPGAVNEGKALLESSPDCSSPFYCIGARKDSTAREDSEILQEL